MKEWEDMFKAKQKSKRQIYPPKPQQKQIEN
jgi:hypothetical protein